MGVLGPDASQAVIGALVGDQLIPFINLQRPLPRRWRPLGPAGKQERHDREQGQRGCGKDQLVQPGQAQHRSPTSRR